MVPYDLASTLNMCRSMHVLEIVTESGLIHQPQPIIDEVLNQVTKPESIDALSALGLKPSMIDGYYSAIVWGHTFDESEAQEIGERLLNGPDFLGSSQRMLKTSLEAIGFTPNEYRISSVYVSGNRKNVSTTLYKLKLAKTVRVTAGIALLRSLYVPCIQFWHAFLENATHLCWDKCITHRHVVECLSSVMNRSHCDLVRRTMVGVRAIVDCLGYNFAEVVTEAYHLCRPKQSAFSAAAAMLLYVPESRVSWFPGIKSPVVDMFLGQPSGYIESQKIFSLVRSSEDLSVVALKAGAFPPLKWNTGPFLEWKKPIYKRRDVYMAPYMYQIMVLIMWCTIKTNLPREVQLLIADAFYTGRKI